MDQDQNTPVSLDYMVRRLTWLMEDQKRMQEGDYSRQASAEHNLKFTKQLLGQLALDLDIYGWQMDKALEGHRFEEVDLPPMNNLDPVPMANMPWNIPGSLHSPEAIPASEYVDREMIHQMTVREDLLSQDE